MFAFLKFLPLLLIFSGKAWADTCPRIQDLKPLVPPAGWSILVGPDYPLAEYRFSSAIHSLNGTFYYEQVICRYDICPSFGCPAFTLLSNKRYEQPWEAKPPWNYPPIISYTLVCLPSDHNPAHCVFQ